MRKIVDLLTPGGDLEKAVKSETHSRSEYSVKVNPTSVSLILDSLACVSGTTRDLNRSLIIDWGATENWRLLAGSTNL